MSLFPLDLDRFKEWSIQQLYYLLFPYIKEDFMGRGDCEVIHKEGNMTVTTSNGPTNVTHIISGGSDLLLSIKEARYRARAEEGSIKISVAEETGRFTG